MTHRVAFAPEALDQLAALTDYIAAESTPEIATRYVEAIVTYCQKLKIHPRRGTRRDDLFPGLRTVGFKRRATIAFVVGEAVVTIIGVFYGGQDFETGLRPTRPS